MGLIDLFIVNDENKGDASDNKNHSSPPINNTSNDVVKFPDATNNTPFTNTQSVPSNSVTDEALKKAVSIYQNGFDSLNQPGYDFYEFYQSIISGGTINEQSYKMAFGMGVAMDKSITKDKLIQQADFYLSEIKKVHSSYIDQGNKKLNELTEQKNSENQSLTNELNSLRQQMEALQVQIKDRESKLSAIDSKYTPKLSEIEIMLQANDFAKEKIAKSIEEVQQGIRNNIS